MIPVANSDSSVRRSGHRGFTLVEMLTVVVIVGVIG